MPRKENPGPISAQAQQDLVSEGIENFELPKSVVMKIAKSALPDEARLTKETVLALVKGSTVFINYIGACAHDIAISKQHKTISAADVLKALDLIDFGDVIAALEAEVKVFKQTGGASSRKSAKESSSGAVAAAGMSASTAGRGFSISIPPSGGASAGPGSIRLPAPSLSTAHSQSASASTSAVGTPTGGVPALTLKVKSLSASASVSASASPVGGDGDGEESDEEGDESPEED
ncbi:histone-fold-containing protein [Coprinellus micaceus]|uniref:DNA polymerase epsilon subunit D n=1 Tax=Coprinellus micaceus TaxID=71717 RepID=A0A4Y7SLU2_COPMI|nr:histone-fold-containing protein [Coprinellus micaceus]